MNHIRVHRQNLTESDSRIDCEVQPFIRQMFSVFQNLNLLALIEDLRTGQLAFGDWASSRQLCPVSHGMPNGQTVGDLCYLSAQQNLKRACAYASRFLSADAQSIFHFVERWDDHRLGVHWLLDQLEALWFERLVDAHAVQRVLDPFSLRVAVEQGNDATDAAGSRRRRSVL